MATVYGPDVDIAITVTEWPRQGAWDQFALFGRLVVTSNGGVLQQNLATNTYNGYSVIVFDSGPGQVDVLLYRSTGASSSNMLTGTLLGQSLNLVAANGDVIGLRCLGTTIEAYHNGVAVVSAVDATYSAAGFAGVFIPGNNNDANSTNPGIFDDFRVGTIGLPTNLPATLPIVPGAFGFGMDTRAAYGGGVDPIIVRVTNLNNSGPGSLRDALEMTVPRFIIFEVSGTIELSSDIIVTAAYVYLAGETAPDPGITVKNFGIQWYTHDWLMNHIRCRPGDLIGPPIPQTQDHDASIAYTANCYNFVYAHCSLSWGQGKNTEAISIASGGKGTYWENILSEPLYYGKNVIISAGQPSSLNMLLAGGPMNVSVIGNLFAKGSDRNPEIHEEVNAHVINNVMFAWGYDFTAYNWATFLFDGGVAGNPFKADVIGNVYIAGGGTHPFNPLYAIGEWNARAGSEIYETDNILDDTASPGNLQLYFTNTTDHRIGTPPVSLTGITVRAGSTVKAYVLSKAGARSASRDAVDLRIINEVTARTGTMSVQSQQQVGGWPNLAVNTRALTTPASPHVVQPSGYTALEEWAHGYAVAVQGFVATGAFPASPVADPFTRANAPSLGTNWAGFVQTGGQTPTAGIANNRATNTNFIYPFFGWGYLYGPTTTPSYAPPSAGTGPTTFAPLLGTPLPPDPVLQFALHHHIPNRPGYEHGFIPGKIREIDAISRGLSTMDGDPVGTQVTVTVDDQDRETRVVLDTAGSLYLDGYEGTFKFETETRRQQELPPSVVSRGFVKSYGLRKRRKASFTTENQLLSEYGPLASRRLISDRRLVPSLMPGLPPQLSGVGQRLILGLVGDWGAVDPSTGLPAEKGMVRCYAVGQRQIGGSDYTEFHLCGHACESIDIYGADASNSKRVLVDPAEYGSIILAPGKPGWPFGPKYLDLTDSATGRVHRVTHFFILTTDIKAQSHLNNGISIACNVCGMEEYGDGEGRVVTELFYAWQMVWDNWLAPNVGYHSGLYLGAPTFTDGTSMTDSASFQAAQQKTVEWIGGRGYQVGTVFQDILALGVMQHFAITGHANWGERMSGQMMVSLIDHTVVVTSTPHLTAPVRLRGGIVPEYQSGTIQNPILVAHDFDHDAGHYRTPAVPLRDQQAITDTGGIERPVTVELFATRDQATAMSSGGNRLFWRRFPLQMVEVPTGKEGLNLENGDIIRVTSEDGPGSLGFQEAPMRLMKHTFYPKKQTCLLEAMVLEDQLNPVVLSQTSGTPFVEILSQTNNIPVPEIYSI